MVDTILVTDANRGSGLSILRSLGRKGYRVIAGASAPAIGFRSRYVTATTVYPAPEKDPEAFVDHLLACVQREQVALIIPVTDEVLLPLSAQRQRFAGLCKIAMPEPDQLDVVTNKLKTLELAQQHGVPIPKTRVLTTAAQAAALSGELTWPVVLKPMRSRQYNSGHSIEAFKVSYAQSAEDLHRQMTHYEGRCEVLLQEYHRGEGQGVELLLWEGAPICAFQHRRLHEVPITGGASAFRASMPIDPQLYDYSLRMLRALKWSGLAMVEFKQAADGPCLMEINGRVWGSLPLAVHSGMDFPARLAELYLSNTPRPPVEVNTNYRHGLRARNLSLDIVWLLSVLRGGKHPAFLQTPARSELLPAVLEYFNPLIKTDTQSWDDPLPGLFELPQIATKLFKKVH